jgi:hypothetical protein
MGLHGLLTVIALPFIWYYMISHKTDRVGEEMVQMASCYQYDNEYQQFKKEPAFSS